MYFVAADHLFVETERMLAAQLDASGQPAWTSAVPFGEMAPFTS